MRVLLPAALPRPSTLSSCCRRSAKPDAGASMSSCSNLKRRQRMAQHVAQGAQSPRIAGGTDPTQGSARMDVTARAVTYSRTDYRYSSKP